MKNFRIFPLFSIFYCWNVDELKFENPSFFLQIYLKQILNELMEEQIKNFLFLAVVFSPLHLG